MVVVACSLLAGALLAVAAAPGLVLKTLYRGDGAAVGVALLPIVLGSLLRANMPDAPACFEEVFEANRRQSQDTLDG